MDDKELLPIDPLSCSWIHKSFMTSTEPVRQKSTLGILSEHSVHDKWVTCLSLRLWVPQIHCSSVRGRQFIVPVVLLYRSRLGTEDGRRVWSSRTLASNNNSSDPVVVTDINHLRYGIRGTEEQLHTDTGRVPKYEGEYFQGHRVPLTWSTPRVKSSDVRSDRTCQCEENFRGI